MFLHTPPGRQLAIEMRLSMLRIGLLLAERSAYARTITKVDSIMQEVRLCISSTILHFCSISIPEQITYNSEVSIRSKKGVRSWLKQAERAER